MSRRDTSTISSSRRKIVWAFVGALLVLSMAVNLYLWLQGPAKPAQTVTATPTAPAPMAGWLDQTMPPDSFWAEEHSSDGKMVCVHVRLDYTVDPFKAHVVATHFYPDYVASRVDNDFNVALQAVFHKHTAAEAVNDLNTLAAEVRNYLAAPTAILYAQNVVMYPTLAVSLTKGTVATSTACPAPNTAG